MRHSHGMPRVIVNHRWQDLLDLADGFLKERPHTALELAERCRAELMRIEHVLVALRSRGLRTVKAVPPVEKRYVIGGTTER